jgi:hypothetical protein
MTSDFDILLGSWKIQNRYLKGRLQGSQEWIEFSGRSEVRPLLNGLGNVDRFIATRDGQPLEGMHLRLLNPTTAEWSLYWADTSKPGILQPPMTGKFQDGCGEFFGEDEVQGRKVLSRYRWEFFNTDSPNWEQAFSPDEGKSWETNWTMRFTRTGDLLPRDGHPNGHPTWLKEAATVFDDRIPRRVAFKSGTKTVVVQLQQLQWVEAQRDYVLLHLGQERHIVRSTMSRMETSLDPRHFCRIHRSAIVNIDHVKEIKTGAAGEASVIMRDGTALPLSRSYKDPLFAALEVKPLSQVV